MKEVKTLQTVWFESKKKEKVGTARFSNGRQALERTLWKVGDEEFVKVGGNVWTFRRYEYINADKNDGYIYGCI